MDLKLREAIADAAMGNLIRIGDIDGEGIVLVTNKHGNLIATRPNFEPGLLRALSIAVLQRLNQSPEGKEDVEAYVLACAGWMVEFKRDTTDEEVSKSIEARPIREREDRSEWFIVHVSCRDGSRFAIMREILRKEDGFDLGKEIRVSSEQTEALHAYIDDVWIK